MIHIDSFDADLTRPLPRRRMTAKEHDIETLKSAKRVSYFWITETARRARLVTDLVRSGVLILDNSPGFPWSLVAWKGE